MKIDSVFSPAPQDPKKRSSVRSESDVSSTPAGEIFAGPQTGKLTQKAQTLDAVRHELVDDVKNQLKNGSYFTEERIIKVAEKLSSQL